ncbi:hypothetical protein SDC9_150096 [bioreactor metagenome]|uniref:Uncharacterized protein n=1 Tax=bioreactor metagenome TaxID=1076179 RepID=A0A645ELF4_9ZZZZ
MINSHPECKIETSISSILVSVSKDKWEASTFSLCARSLIWWADSSPETYKTFFVSARVPHNCSRRVDFPTPGSPHNSKREPGTKPPPKTLSSSAILQDTLSDSDAVKSFILTALNAWPEGALVFLDGKTDSITCSVILFHVPHSGHFPLHFGA